MKICWYFWKSSEKPFDQKSWQHHKDKVHFTEKMVKFSWTLYKCSLPLVYSLCFFYNLGNGRLWESRGPATLSYVACTNRTTTQHLCDLRFSYGNQHVCWITFPWWWQVKINRTKNIFFKGIENRSDILKKFIFNIKNVLHVSARYSY